MEGFLRAFDPDLLVVCGDVDKTMIASREADLTMASDIDVLAPGQRTCIGLSVAECYGAFAEAELKFVRKVEPRLVVPRVGGSHNLLAASMFGELPDTVLTRVETALEGYASLEYMNVKIETAHELLGPDILFPRRMAMFDLTGLRQSEPWGRLVIHAIDGQSPLDIVDYWNLRAMGWSVLPFPRELADSADFTDFLSNEIAEQAAAQSDDSSYRPAVAIVKGRTLTQEQCDLACKALTIPPKEPEAGRRHTVSHYHWYPRVWTDFGRRVDSAEPHPVTAGSRRYHVGDDEFNDEVRSVGPTWVRDRGLYGVKFANDVEVFPYSLTGELAEVLPEGPQHLANVSGVSTMDARLSRRGPVVLAYSSDKPLFYRVPKAEDALKAWLFSKKMPVELSSAGQKAKAMLAHLRSLSALRLFAHPEAIELLGTLADGKVAVKRVRQIANRIARRLKGIEADFLISQWTESGIFKLVAEMQCPHCVQYSLYGLNELDYSLKCSHCRKTFDVPLNAPNDWKWHYIADGPLRGGSEGYSAFCVLLTLAFFREDLHWPVSALLSCVEKNNPDGGDVDLTLLMRKDRVQREGPSLPILAFAECKMGSRFERKDVDRMAALGKRFPEATLIFATLKAKLSPDERKMIRELAMKGRRSFSSRAEANRVLVLTSLELFIDSNQVVDRWHKADLLKGHSVHLDFEDPMSDLCDHTQHLHLKMKDIRLWTQQQLARNDKRAKKRKKRDVVEAVRVETGVVT